MRYIILTISSILLLVHTVTGQKDFQIEVDTPYNRLQVLLGDTSSASATYGLASWELVDSVKSAFADQDWYKLGGTTIPTNSDSAYRSGYTLFNGLSGGLPTKIEMLKEGILQFDYTNESSGETKVYQIVKPLQQSEGNVPWVSSIFTAANYGDRWNDVHSMGWNMEGGNVLEAGKQAFGWVCEGFYQQNATRLRFEDHTIWYGVDGIQRRPESLVITDGYYDEWYKYFTVNDVFGLDPRNNYKSFQFALDADTTISKMYLWSPQSANTKAAEFQWNTTTNRLSISPYGTSNSTFDINAFPFTRAALIQRTEVASTYGLTMATIAGNTSDGYFGNITPGWGLTLASDILKADTSKLATQYDLTLVSGGATDLTIGGSGPTYTIESSTGTDVTIAAGGINALSESPANTLVITATEVDGSTTNEIQDLSITGASSPFTLDISGSSNDVSFSQLFGIILGESPANTLTIKADTSVLATPYDISGFGTMSNWLLAASGTGGTETVTNGETVTVSETTGLDVTRSTNTVAVALSIDEFTTDGTIEEDELLLAYDPSGTNHELIDVNSLPYIATEVDGSTTNEIQDITVTGASQPFTVDLSSDATDMTLTGAGITTLTRSTNAITITSTEVDGSTTNEAWTIDADDADTEVIGNQTVKFEGLGGIATNYIPLTNTLEIDASGVTGSGDGDGIYDGDGTTPTDVDVTMTDNIRFGTTTDNDLFIDGSNDRVGIGTGSPAYGLHVLSDAGAAVESKTAGTGGLIFKLEGKADGGGANISQSTISMAYTDADYAGGVEQQGLDMTLYKESDAAQWTTVKMRMTENTDADMIVMEKNEGFANTTESHLAMNAGIAFTQNYDLSTSGDLNLDRSYYTINITGGSLTDTIKLPEVASTADNWTSALTDAQVQVGQEYVISNLRIGVNLIVGAYNPAGTSDDLIGTRTPPGGSAGSAISLAPGKSAIIKCYQLAGGIGYWNYWLSN